VNLRGGEWLRFFSALMFAGPGVASVRCES